MSHYEENPIPVPPAGGAVETDSSYENSEDYATVGKSYGQDIEVGRPTPHL